MGFWAQNTSGEVAAVHMPKSKRIMWGGGGPGCPGQAMRLRQVLQGPKHLWAKTPTGKDLAVTLSGLRYKPFPYTFDGLPQRGDKERAC